MKILNLFVAFLSIVSCAGLPPGSKKPQLSYEKVRSLEPGKTSQDEIRHNFGEPDLKSVLPGSGEQVWAYSRGRLLLSFNAKTLSLSSVDWSVYDADAEKSLAVAKSHFPGSAFTETREEWTNPHAGPTETYFSDKKTGVTITTKMKSSEVNSIFREVPNTERKPSTAKAVKFQL
jgi:hypothetical protein